MALDIWALGIWQVDGRENRAALETLYAVGVLRIMRWGEAARMSIRGVWPPKSLQAEDEIGAYPRRQAG